MCACGGEVVVASLGVGQAFVWVFGLGVGGALLCCSSWSWYISCT